MAFSSATTANDAERQLLLLIFFFRRGSIGGDGGHERKRSLHATLYDHRSNVRSRSVHADYPQHIRAMLLRRAANVHCKSDYNSSITPYGRLNARPDVLVPFSRRSHNSRSQIIDLPFQIYGLQVSRGFADAKKQNRNKPRPTADGSRRQPQASTTVMLGTRESTAPARPGTSQPCTTATADERALAAAGRIWRAPSRRHDSLQRPCGGLWTAATTLGVIVLFGRVTALVFMCSCLYGARFVRLRLPGAGASASAKTSGGVARAGSRRRLGDPVGVASEKIAELCVTEECKKKVVMAGLLRRPSPRFGR
jgi:hypothetical protein